MPRERLRISYFPSHSPQLLLFSCPPITARQLKQKILKPEENNRRTREEKEMSPVQETYRDRVRTTYIQDTAKHWSIHSADTLLIVRTARYSACESLGRNMGSN